MAKAIKWILILGAGFACLLVIAIISLPFIVNPNDYKGQISSMMERKTGRAITIPGDITLQVSPKLDIIFSLGEVNISAGKGFADTHFLTSKLAEVEFALWPLLIKQQLQVGNIDLQGVQLNLIRRQDGTSNWADLVGLKGAGVAAPPGQPPVEQPLNKQKPLLAGLEIGGINISDINVEFDDQRAGKIMSLNNFSLSVGHIRPGSQFPVSTDFEFLLDGNKQKQPVSGAVKTDFNLIFNPDKQQFIIAGLTLGGLFSGEMLPESELAVTVFADAEINLGAEEIIVQNLRVQHGDFRAETALFLTGFKQPLVKGTLRVFAYSLKKHLAQLGISLPEFSDPRVLERFSASLGFTFQSEQLQVKNIQIQLDDTVIMASGSVSDFKQPVYVLEVHMDKLDLDRYSLKRKETGLEPEPVVAKAETGQQVSADHPLIPVQLLKGLRFNADLNIDSLTAAKLNLSAIKLRVDGRDGLVTVKPFSANLYDGSIIAAGKIDVRPALPLMSVDKKLKGVQLGPMFADMTGKKEITGRANIDINLKTKGINPNELTKNANGTVKLSLEDGIIKRLEILETIRTAKAFMEQKPVSRAAESQPTGFATLTASGMLVNGVFKNDDLEAASELMKVTGKGQVDFVQEQIDYLLTIRLTDRIERGEATGLVELGKMAIPYRIRGSFTDIQQSAALEELFKDRAKELLMGTIQKKLDPGTDGKEEPALDTDALINRGLQGLFGN